MAGHSILQVGSKEAVIEWVKRFPGPISGEEFEIRPMFEDGDFGGNETPELREADTRPRATVAEQHPSG